MSRPIKNLKELYKQADNCKFCKMAGNNLNHIFGFGSMNPRLMLILINPTHRNLSSDPKYKGSRFPFIGVRQFWKVLADGGLMSKEIAYALPKRDEWCAQDTELIEKELIKNNLFLSNIVKCCYGHSFYPEKEVIEDQLRILRAEINFVKPKSIIAFGGLVYKTLTGRNIKLSAWNDKKEITQENISGLGISVVPCYFPIGRGNPNKASDVLARLTSGQVGSVNNNSCGRGKRYKKSHEK